jgi:hypothetical protein
MFFANINHKGKLSKKFNNFERYSLDFFTRL